MKSLYLNKDASVRDMVTDNGPVHAAREGDHAGTSREGESMTMRRPARAAQALRVKASQAKWGSAAPNSSRQWPSPKNSAESIATFLQPVTANTWPLQSKCHRRARPATQHVDTVCRSTVRDLQPGHA